MEYTEEELKVVAAKMNQLETYIEQARAIAVASNVVDAMVDAVIHLEPKLSAKDGRSADELAELVLLAKAAKRLMRLAREDAKADTLKGAIDAVVANRKDWHS